MDIDLAGKTIGRVRKTQKAKRLLDQAVIWGALILSLLLIAIASTNLLVNKSNQGLSGRIKTKEKEIESMSKIESQQVYLTGKLASFGVLVKTHEVHQAVADTVFNLIPSGTSLKGFEVDETGLINLSGTVPGWQLLSRLFDNLKEPTGPLTVSGFKVKQINFSGGGGINFDLELNLKT